MQVVGRAGKHKTRVPALLEVVGLSDKIKRFPDGFRRRAAESRSGKGSWLTIPRL